MQPFVFQHKDLESHPLFINLSLIQYVNTVEKDLLIGSGKAFICFTYGNFNKITSQGSKPEIGPVEVQPVENFYHLGSSNHSKLIAIGIKPDLLYNIVELPENMPPENLFPLLPPALQELFLQLRNRLSNVVDIKEAEKIIIKNLSPFIHQWSAPTPLTPIINMIFEKEGKTTIQEILNHFPVSKSSLHSYFKRYIGFPPNFYIRLIRFNFFLRSILRNSYSIQEAIYQNEYFDYSHLKKDFARFTGITPKELNQIKNKSLIEVFEKINYRIS